MNILLHRKTDLLSPHGLGLLAHSCFLCQFVCIAQQDYCCILNQVEKNMQKVEEEGEIVMVKEHRELDRTGTRKGHIVIKVRTQLIMCDKFVFFSYPEVKKCSEM